MGEELRPHVDASHAQAVIIGDYATMIATFNQPPLTDKQREKLAEIADRMAIAVHSQWSYEAKWRQLYDPYAMPVRWEPADPRLFVGWASLQELASKGPGWPARSAGSWAASEAELGGTDNELLDVVERVPTRRLVVLGEPGSGKTILLVRLVLDVLSRRTPGQPVPVLIPMGAWNPAIDDLLTWMERWLTTESPALSGRSPVDSKRTIARSLLDAGFVMPVLDGLDEMPEQLCGIAIKQINDGLQPGQAIVLASRTQAFEKAVRPETGTPIVLAGAAGVELKPLDLNVVATYLAESAGGEGPAARWNRTAATFRKDPSSPVAQALSTPLMAALARAAYNPRPGENIAAVARHPDEMLDQAAFPTRTDVEGHLFEIFIPAAYRPHPDERKRSRWNAEQATRWLRFIARDLEERQTGTDLAWWQLSGVARLPLGGLFVGLATGISAALWIPWKGWGIGLLTATVIGLLVRNRLPSIKPGLPAGLTGGLIGGELAALVALALFGTGQDNFRLSAFVAGGVSVGIAVAPMSQFYAGIVAAFFGALAIAVYERTPIFDSIRAAIGDGSFLINGLAFGVGAGLAAGLFNRRTPARGLRWSWLGFGSGVVIGAMFGFIVWVTAGQTVGIISGVAGIFAGALGGGLYEAAAPTDLTKATGPSTVLARDRTMFFVSLALVLPVGVAAALGSALSPPDPFNGPHYGVAYGVGIGIALFIGVGLALAFYQTCWGGFTLTRCWLAVSRRIPFRLMTFLEDAHINKGVLRQVGAVYQFRHAEFQRHLAETTTKLTKP